MSTCRGCILVGSMGFVLRRVRVRVSGAAGLILALAACGGGAVDPGFQSKEDEAKPPESRAESVSFSPVVFERPRVVVIRADWCGACKRVEPVLMQALTGYEGRIDLVVLDVSDDEAIARSEKLAEEAGVLDAFNAAENRTPTVLVARSSDAVATPVGSLVDPDTFVRAFDDALGAAR